MRKLASIQRIESLTPIRGKDMIVLARVLGWQVIVRKADYNVGDLCVYVEIDSVMPEKPEFEFLRSKNFRIKTMKMAGVVSQGICFPLSILPAKESAYEVGEDVTEVLGITKYDEYQEEPPAKEPERKSWLRQFMFKHPLTRPLAKRIWGGSSKERLGFPEFIAKTDEIRVQTLDYAELLARDLTYEVHEKIDGQSGTFILSKRKHRLPFTDRYEFMVCSRNWRLNKPDDSSYWAVAEKYRIRDVLEKLIGSHDFICIQGECVGPKIQGNPYRKESFDLYCFNLVTPEGRIDSVIAEKMVAKYGLKWVPAIDLRFTLPDTVDELLQMATGESKLYPTLREGLVLRNYENGISFKAVSNEYLMKHCK